jgi:hypothetical protein
MINKITSLKIIVWFAKVPGISLQKISDKVGCSRSAVTRVLCQYKEHGLKFTPTIPIKSPIKGVCSTCGYKVSLPCVACAANEYKRRRI